MEKVRSLYAIYKFDFHKSQTPTVLAAAEGIDGAKYVKHAQTCFASLFDGNSIDKLAKKKNGEVVTLFII